MVRARGDAPARRKLQLEHRLRTAAEDVGHHARDQPEMLVEREHLDVACAGLVQRAHRGGRAVGERDLGAGDEAAGLAQVGEHRPLVGAVLELTVELREGDHGRFELARQDLQPARELGDLDLAVLRPPGRRHQLEVVDDDQPEVAVAGLDPPGLGSHLHDGAVWVVVDEERGFGEPADRLVDARPLVLRELAGLQLARLHARFGGEEPLGELEVTHLHREEEHRLAADERDVLRHSERQRRLPLSGTRRDDREGRRLHAEQQGVEIAKARGGADDVALMAVQRLELVHRLFERGVQRHERVGDAPFGDLEDRGLGAVERVVDRVLRRVRHLLDAARGLDEPP